MMFKVKNPLLTVTVGPDWIDYNGHMNDSAYVVVFSMAVDQLMVDLGINEEFRERMKYSIYTLETHLCYLQEAHKDQVLHVDIQLLDYDSKRLHVFFTIKNDKGDRLATSEQMLMGMDMESGRPAPFPDEIATTIATFGQAQQNLEKPNEAGRNIYIRRK